MSGAWNDVLLSAVVIGAGATATTDAWTIARKHLFGSVLPDYGLVGRWFAHMAQGRFRHASISAASCARGEVVIGWLAHYLIGIAFASLLLAIWGIEWVRHPTPLPALIVGLGSVAAPWLLMQPGMGAGIAGSRTPNPRATRLRSLVTHGVFALGLYLAGWATSWLKM